MKQTYENAQAYQKYCNMAEDLQSFPFTFTYKGTTYRGFGTPSFKAVGRTTTWAPGALPTWPPSTWIPNLCRIRSRILACCASA